MQTPRSWGSLAQDNGLSYFALRVQVIDRVSQDDSQESVDKAEEMNGGVIFAGTNHLSVVEGWANQRRLEYRRGRAALQCPSAR